MSEFFTSKRIVTTALAMSLGLVGCGTSPEVNGDDLSIENLPSPHSQNSSIPEGKVLPPDVAVEFRNGSAEYHAPPEVAAKTGLFAVTAFCGHPINKHDPQNLYAVMSVRREDGEVWGVTAAIAAAPACDDNTINAADRPVL